MAEGNVTRRGDRSWRIKYDDGADPATGRRITKFITIRGTRKDAERELRRRLTARDTGTAVDPTRITVADWMATWLDDIAAIAVAPKTLERYRGLSDAQIVPHLGATLVQKLRPAHVQSWHATLLKAGRKDGGALAARTVGHAHRVLRKALSDATRLEVVARNVTAGLSPPKVAHKETPMLDGDAITEVFAMIAGSPIYPIAVTAFATGARRGEILALRWADVDLDAGRVRIERSLEQTTTGGIQVKSPKTTHGRRTISLPRYALDVLLQHRKRQLELRMAAGVGKMPDDALVFGRLDGSYRSPRALTKEWSRVLEAHDLPKVTFHALRHSHASALIAAGLDVVTVSRRLGHGSAAITLGIYSHIFADGDDRASAAIDGALGHLR